MELTLLYIERNKQNICYIYFSVTKKVKNAGSWRLTKMLPVFEPQNIHSKNLMKLIHVSNKRISMRKNNRSLDLFNCL